MVEEDGPDVTVRLTHESARGIAAEAIEVRFETGRQRESSWRCWQCRVARATAISIESAPEFEQPGAVRLKIFRYNSETASYLRGCRLDSRPFARGPGRTHKREGQW